MAGPNPTSWTTSLPALEKTHRSTQGDGRVPQQTAYTERYRPQFHFTARRNWLNDPNGCVFYDGEYHLFFQHNPSGLDWGNMTWGHAVSTDLVHWRQLSHALLPYGDGTIFSGSAVVDSKNLSGLGHGQEGLLVAAFTHARKPFGQAIAFSHDRGRTWERYADGEHVVPNQGLDDGERDPKVLWHEPSRKWVMVLWVQRNRARFFTSSNLRQWRHASDVVAQGFYECPDLFELPVDGDEQNTRWVLHDAAFNYWIGSFDGTTFRPEAGPIQGDFGGNFYAAQTWNNTGKRVVQIAWMRGGQYPGMPFNQQMSFPCELALRTTPAGVRLCRTPVREIEGLYLRAHEVCDKRLNPGQDLCVGPLGDLSDIQAEVEMSHGAGFSLRLHDQAITCIGSHVTCLGRTAPLAAADGLISLRLLVDRTSIELFGNDGQVCMSSCFLPVQADTNLQLQAQGGAIRIRYMVIHRLASAWQPDPAAPRPEQ